MKQAHAKPRIPDHPLPRDCSTPPIPNAETVSLPLRICIFDTREAQGRADQAAPEPVGVPSIQGSVNQCHSRKHLHSHEQLLLQQLTLHGASRDTDSLCPHLQPQQHPQAQGKLPSILAEAQIPPTPIGPRAHPQEISHPWVLMLQQGQLALVQGCSERVHMRQLCCRVHQHFQCFGRHPSTDGRVDPADSPQH